MPCHCTAAGKALLAWRQPWRETVLTQPLEAFTDRTVTGPEWLRKELAKTVARGYSIEDREHDISTRGVGAAVFAGTRHAIAAIAVAAPVSRLAAERYPEIGLAATEAADALSAALS